MNKRNIKRTKIVLSIIFCIVLLLILNFTRWNFDENIENKEFTETNTPTVIYDISNIPEYSGNIYVEINGNIPKFTEDDMNIENSYYSELIDNRAGMAMIKTNWKKANEDDKKDDYTSINISGYIQKSYDKSIVKGGYLYNRCHIIAWKLGGVDNDKRNLMTGTRDFNIKGMKKFEDDIYEYLKNNPKNSVLYRATPYFENENQLASRNQFRSIIY